MTLRPSEEQFLPHDERQNQSLRKRIVDLEAQISNYQSKTHKTMYTMIVSFSIMCIAITMTYGVTLILGADSVFTVLSFVFLILPGSCAMIMATINENYLTP
ncbi:hypothetical protein P154DRAFT_574055 [Amniculicola lignicola CBS 123094]|uniref:Uncharacterized protein n=1 Tax=Amniculicola lignicola CBS 123094 TaxID=1392246 RepID=A0A6A5WTR9_9PLEO|nr:hypothetical protein P154DRAFT_574055 [Amniculicola lignicola CBS 123094]